MASAPATAWGVTPSLTMSRSRPRARLAGIASARRPLSAIAGAVPSTPTPTPMTASPPTAAASVALARRTARRSRDVARTTTSAVLSSSRTTARDQSAVGAMITNTSSTSVIRNTAPYRWCAGSMAESSGGGTAAIVHPQPATASPGADDAMIAALIGERTIEGFRALTLGRPGALEAAFVPDAGMVGCSLRHRGEELLGLRSGLRGYADERKTMGIPLLYPWA